jgi:glucose/arabinose dehydrogenase
MGGVPVDDQLAVRAQSSGMRRLCRLVALALITVSCVQPAPPAAPPPLWTAPGFQLIEVASGLTLPTSVAFTPSGRMFVAEKRGTIKAFPSVDDPTPTTVIDLSADVYEHADRGMLGMTVDPQFESGRPYLYALYSAEAPLFGDNPNTLDSCSLDGDDGCVIPSKLVRITVDTTTMHAVGAPVLLASNWCSQYSSHSIGDVKFGADGGLYASAGEGASFTNVDYGQLHGAKLLNPCNGPPTGIGVLPTPPTAAGGALRAQSAAVPVPGFHASSDGAVIKIDPDTGAAFPTNPWASDPDPERAKIVGYGYRNPFRLAARPGTTEMWVSDVGWHVWEEIDVIDSTASAADNFGWPCMEGPEPLVAFQAVGLDLCTRLYDDPSLVKPSFYSYAHKASAVPNDGCPTHGSSAAAGMAFYEGGTYPDRFVGGLIFSDYARGCTYLFPLGADGQPDASRAEPILRGFNSVDLEIGPGGDVYEVEHNAGKIVRLIYDLNGHPTASIKASSTKGSAPLTVTLDGSRSSDPDQGDTLTYAWDLDGDGQYDDSTDATTSVTFTDEGVHTVRLQVTDSHGATGRTSTTIEVGDQYPHLTYSSPAASLTWSTGDTIAFSGSAVDPQDGPLPASALHWTATLHHCVDGSLNDCHLHPLATWDGVASGDFLAPDHEYPSYIELTFSATDSNGNSVSESRELHPNSVQLQVLSDPPGATVVVGEQLGPTPLQVRLITHSKTTVIANEHQTIGGVPYDFVSWSDGGAAIHEIDPTASTTLIATFAPSAP